MADGVPTPELEKSFTVKTDKDSVVSVYPLKDDNCRAVVENWEWDSDTLMPNATRYTLMNLKDGSVSPVAIPKDSINTATWNSDGRHWAWLVDNGIATYSLDKQQTDIHPYKIRDYKNKFLSFTSDGNNAYVVYRNSHSNLKKLDIYDLGSNSVIQSYSFTKNEGCCALSKDGSRLYIPSIDTDSKTVKLKILNTSDGSTSIKTARVKGDVEHLDIHAIKSYKSDSYLIRGGCYLIKADRDGNMNVIQNDSSHAIKDTFNNDDYYTVYKRSGAKKLYAKDDDGSSYLDIDNADLSVCAIDGGREVGTIKYPFKDGELCGLSGDGSVLLGYNDKEDKRYLSLVDSQTGAKSETKIDAKWSLSIRFLHGDREVLVAYTDKKDDSILHVDIYKSNIPHSVIDDVLYFAQNNLPVVIGSGVVLVLIIGGVVVVCVRRRKKRSGSKDDAAGAAPKAKKQKRSRRRKKGQQEDTAATATDTASQQPASQTAAPASQPTTSLSTPAAPAQQPTSSAPQETAPQQVTPQPPAAASAPRFCRHCGSPLTPGSKFCPKCGHPVG